MSPCKQPTKPRFSDERIRRFLTDCFFGHLEGMKEGLEEGLDPNLDRFGECPLEGALESQKFEAVKLIVDHGADVFRKGMLHRAASKSEQSFLLYMVRAGNKQDPSRVASWVNEWCGRDHDWAPQRKQKTLQWTALEWVVLGGKVESTCALLEAGANPEPVTRPRGSNPPHPLVVHAVVNSRWGPAGALLIAGADPTPLMGRLKGVHKDLLDDCEKKDDAAPWRAYWAQKALEDSLPQAEATEATEVPRKRF